MTTIVFRNPDGSEQWQWDVPDDLWIDMQAYMAASGLTLQQMIHRALGAFFNASALDATGGPPKFFRPLSADHPAIGLRCLKCHVPFVAGDNTCVITRAVDADNGLSVEVQLQHAICPERKIDG